MAEQSTSLCLSDPLSFKKHKISLMKIAAHADITSNRQQEAADMSMTAAFGVLSGYSHMPGGMLLWKVVDGQ